MSSFNNNAMNAPNATNKKMDPTELGARLGDFGVKMMEHVMCSIGAHVWTNHGLTLQDKADFEEYQDHCDVASHTSLLKVANDTSYYCLTLLSKIKKYEDVTPPEKRALIESIVTEVIALYEIDNVNPCCLKGGDCCEGCDKCVEECLMTRCREADMMYTHSEEEDDKDYNSDLDDDHGRYSEIGEAHVSPEYDSEYYRDKAKAYVYGIDGYGSN